LQCRTGHHGQHGVADAEFHGGGGPPHHSRGGGTAQVDSFTEIQCQAQVFAQGGRREHCRFGDAMGEQAVDACGLYAGVFDDQLR
jgi:hypothetical protein